jgi:hypothetical protein
MHSQPNPQPPAAGPGSNPNQQVQARQWAIVELMGHSRMAGAVSQDMLGTAPLVRVDVPEVTIVQRPLRDGKAVDVVVTIPAHSRSLSAAAIYSINWCDEVCARVAAHGIAHNPLQLFNLRHALASMPEPLRQTMAQKVAHLNLEEDDALGF